jgi:acetate kinase
MGLTPLEGLVMGTRSGDVDPALHAYLGRTAGFGMEAVDALLNRDSGLKGLCGENDMRAIVAAREGGDPAAKLAFDVFCYRARKYVGAYVAVLGRVDALIFTGGIGENAPEVRAGIGTGLEGLGIRMDQGRNAAPGILPADVSTRGSPVRILVLQTDEELEIARQTAACLRNGHPRS